jgi:GT2 family glycosyltransferase/glycosyltransferase involved in cell wall biosynthesis
MDYAETTLAAQAQLVAALNADLSAREEMVRCLSQRLAETEASVAALTRKLTEEQGKVQEFKLATASREQRIQTLTTRAAEREQQVEALNDQLGSIMGSRAWRLARLLARAARCLGPLRDIRRHVHRALAPAVRVLRKDGWRALMGKAARKLAARAFGAQRPESKAGSTPTRADAYQAWLDNNRWNESSRQAAVDTLERLARRPRFSVVMPVYNIDDRWLEHALASVGAQIYPHWELCIADDGSTKPSVRSTLARRASADARLKVRYLSENGGISLATNAAAELASGEFLVFLDHDDELTPDCLLALAQALEHDPGADVLYSDNDKIDTAGRRYAPEFKPDWSPELLLSYMYFTHVVAVRRGLYERVGGLRVGFEGCQDYDLALRATEAACRVVHIPRILYHWRCLPRSTAATGAAKPEAFERGVRAVQDALARRQLPGQVSRPEFARSGHLGIFQIDFPDTGPEVTILIPTKNQGQLLRRCVESIVTKTAYRNYSIVVIDNGSIDSTSLCFFKELPPRCRIVHAPDNAGAFNFARLNNYAAGQVGGDYLLFLNNDTEVRRPEWLSQMVGYGRIPGVGAVGARLLYADGRVQHAGVVVGLHHGLAGHAFKLLPEADLGYQSYAGVARNYSAVTAACMLVGRELFLDVGGFDEARYAVAYNDVDFCLRLREQGYRSVFAPGAELIHHEGRSRGFADSPHERLAFQRSWGRRPDPFYNSNLSLDNEHFEINTRRSAPASRREPRRAVLFTHNLNQEGAPLFLYELAVGLQARGRVLPEINSPSDGPLAELYRSAGIPVHIVPYPLLTVDSATGFRDAVRQTADWIREHGFQLVHANTLDMSYALHAAQEAGCPSLWSVHESVPWQSYSDQLRPALVEPAHSSFGLPYRIVFAAAATRVLFDSIDSRRNFSVIHYGLKRDAINRLTEHYTPREARALVGCPLDKHMVTIVGTVCERKGQLDFARAAAQLLQAGRRDTAFFIVGCRPGPYLAALKAVVQDYASDVYLIPETDAAHVYFRASDMFVCCSINESFPRVILEAMAFRLPIVTTTVFGIAEQVIPGTSALTYAPGDVGKLAGHIEHLLDHPLERRRLGEGAAASLETITSFDAMVESYEQLLLEAFEAAGVDGRVGERVLRDGHKVAA